MAGSLFCIQRQRGDETLFEEIALRATTVWFFPHLEQMVLMWQGNQRINEDDAADVLHLMPALEKNRRIPFGEPLPQSPQSASG